MQTKIYYIEDETPELIAYDDTAHAHELAKKMIADGRRVTINPDAVFVWL